MKVTILGCGASGGVPLIGCDCATCTSTNPRNKRTRVSIFIETNGINLLIDSSPDLRQQALRHNIRRIDAVLYTHDHADHVNGLDDLRSFNYLSNKALSVYGSAATLESITRRFSYAFQPRPKEIWFRPALATQLLPDKPLQEFEVCDVRVTAFEQLHGKGKTTGYRIGNLAYSTDTDQLPDIAFQALEGVDVWIVDCLRYAKSPSHSNLENTLAWISKVKPKLAVLTHMAHELEYEQLAKELPAGVVPAYDGMILEPEKMQNK